MQCTYLDFGRVTLVVMIEADDSRFEAKYFIILISDVDLWARLKVRYLVIQEEQSYFGIACDAESLR